MDMTRIPLYAGSEAAAHSADALKPRVSVNCMLLWPEQVWMSPKSTSTMLAVATAAMAVAPAVGGTSLAAIVAAFFVFEACVGMYFPSIGTLRSKYIPDSHRSVIMNLFGIPLNLLVVSVFLSIRSLGVQGALRCATAALGVATVCMNLLNAQASSESKK